MHHTPVVSDSSTQLASERKSDEPERRTQLQVGKINTDEQQALAGRFSIRSIPTLVLFRNGKEIARRSGSSDFRSLASWVDESLTTGV